jgi:hypothetical protein
MPGCYLGKKSTLPTRSRQAIGAYQQGAFCIDLAAPFARIRRRNGDLFLMKWPDGHRCNRNRADGGTGVLRRDGVRLNPYKQVIFSRACAIKKTLVRCGIGAISRALSNEFQRGFNVRTNTNFPLSPIALSAMAASAVKGGQP